jgi:hypothetical protein
MVPLGHNWYHLQTAAVITITRVVIETKVLCTNKNSYKQDKKSREKFQSMGDMNKE